MKKKYIYSGIILIIFIFIFQWPAAGFNLIDENIRERVQNKNDGNLGEVMSLITELGDGRSSLAIAGFLPDEKARTQAYKSVFVSSAAVFTLKAIIGKKRPPGPIEFKPFTLDGSYHAFPSGHTTTSFALATTIAEYYPEYKKHAYIVASLVGISRLFEDAHWATDVLAGAGLGYVSARLVEIKW